MLHLAFWMSFSSAEEGLLGNHSCVSSESRPRIRVNVAIRALASQVESDSRVEKRHTRILCASRNCWVLKIEMRLSEDL